MKRPIEGIKSVTRARILLKVAKVDQQKTTIFDVVGQNPFSRIKTSEVCVRLNGAEQTPRD